MEEKKSSKSHKTNDFSEGAIHVQLNFHLIYISFVEAGEFILQLMLLTPDTARNKFTYNEQSEKCRAFPLDTKH